VNARLHVESVGHGPPLVLLHGWALHSGVWGPLVPHLAKRFRVHAVDLPGHGRSAPLPAFTLDTVVASLDAAFVRETHPATVVGWSLGGLVAMRWARVARGRIARLALVCTSPRFVAGDGWPHAMSASTLARFGDELHVAWRLTVLRFLALQVHGSEHGRSALASLRHEMFARGDPEPRTLAEALAVIANADLRAELGGVRVPSLVVSGDRDTLAPPAAGEWLAGALPDARFELIAGAAHAPFLSHPAAFSAALDGYFDAR
jgi:pimeloyl-[acyl-carrier protein] methyl ester esterase